MASLGAWVKETLGLGPARRAAPTVDMYFAQPLAGLIGQTDRPIRQLAPTVFASGSAAVIIRYAGAPELREVQFLKAARVYYVIDDDLFAAGPGDGLPEDYRNRLVAFRENQMPAIVALASHVVAPSLAILQRFPGKAGQLLQPASCHTPGGLAHHGVGGGFDIVATGTRSHVSDLTHIAEAVAAFLRETPGARLTTFLGRDAPQVLRGLANAFHLPAMSWHQYRLVMAEKRFHAALAPGLGTAFNLARSPAKIHDHAGFGAAGLYSDGGPFKGVVKAGISGLLLPGEPAAWQAALRNLAASAPLTKGLAAEGQALSGEIGGAARVRNFWLEQLRIN